MIEIKFNGMKEDIEDIRQDVQDPSYCLIYSWFWFDRVRRGGEVVVLPKKISSTFRGNDTITQNRFAVRCFAVLSNLQK